MSILEIPRFNFRSLIGKVDYLQFLLSFNIYCNCDLITVQKTWLHDLYSNNMASLKSCKIFSQDCSIIEKQCGGCVTTFVKTKWFKFNHVCFKFSNDYTDCLTFTCRPKHLTIYIYYECLCDSGLHIIYSIPLC